jgi:type VI secretion system FHA domain protein
MAFFKGAGIEPEALDSQLATTTAFLIGQLLRELLTGLSESLHMRAQQKSQLRLSDSIIQKRDDNALKFCPGAEEALTLLLFGGSIGRFGPVESVRRAFADVRQHQQAVLNALNTAVPKYLNKIAPETIEDKFARAGQTNQVNPNSQVKYWKHYQDLFKIVANRSESGGGLPPQLLDEIAEAYEALTSGDKAANERPKRAKSA